MIHTQIATCGQFIVRPQNSCLYVAVGNPYAKTSGLVGPLASLQLYLTYFCSEAVITFNFASISFACGTSGLSGDLFT